MRAASGIHMQTARMLAPLLGQLWPSSETGMLAEPVVEIAAGGRRLRVGAALGGDSCQSAALAGSDRPGRSAARPRAASALAYVDELARRGRLGNDALHRLATVLDALDVDVPIGIWEAAGRTPQPASGYLPETGRAGRSRAIRAAQGHRPHGSGGHAGARPQRRGGRQYPGLGRCRAGLEARRPRARRPPPGIRSAVRRCGRARPAIDHGRRPAPVDRPVPRDAGGRAGRRRQHAAGLSPRPR